MKPINYVGEATVFLDLDQTLISKELKLFPGAMMFLESQKSIGRKLVIVTNGNRAHFNDALGKNSEIGELVDAAFCREETDTISNPDLLQNIKEQGMPICRDFQHMNAYYKDLRLLPWLLQLETIEAIKGVFIGNIPDIVAAESIAGRLPLFCVDNDGKWLERNGQKISTIIDNIFASEEHPQTVCYNWFNAANQYKTFYTCFQSGPNSIIMEVEKMAIVNDKTGCSNYHLLEYHSHKTHTYVFRATSELEHGVCFQQP